MRILFAGSVFFSIFVVAAVNAEDFFSDLMVSDEMVQEKKLKESQDTARKMLEKPIKVLKLDTQKARIERIEKKEASPVVWNPAPFGLMWLAPIKEIRYLRVSLSPIEVKDMPQTYLAGNLPKPLSAFREVLISFGENDALWRIAAYGKFMQDDSRASKGVAQYQKYYDMLAKKYGNAQQFYQPVVINVEEKIDNGDGTSSIAVRQESMEIGAEGFLDKLMSGEAVLYATFNNSKTGVTLALLADGRGQTYIVVDYKDLSATKLENEEIYDAL